MWYFALFATWPLWVWWPLLIILLFGDLLYVTKKAKSEDFAYCTAGTLFFLVTLHLFGVIDVIKYIDGNYFKVLSALAVYLLAGFPWAYFYEWPRYLKKSYKGRTPRIEQLKEDLSRREDFYTVRNKNELEELQKPILASHNKGKILGWMAWWPAQLLYSAIFQWIQDFWEFVLEKFMNVFQRKADQLHKEFLGE